MGNLAETDLMNKFEDKDFLTIPNGYSKNRREGRSELNGQNDEDLLAV